MNRRRTKKINEKEKERNDCNVHQNAFNLISRVTNPETQQGGTRHVDSALWLVLLREMQKKRRRLTRPVEREFLRHVPRVQLRDRLTRPGPLAPRGNECLIIGTVSGR
jgi:hypothetical protein